MGREPTRPTRQEEQTGRRKRIPLGTPRLKLSASKLIPQGKVGRWINDDPGRLEAAEEGGWTYLMDPKAEIGESATNERDPLSTKVRRRVGTREGGRSKVAYLMVLDKDVYESDQAEKQARIDQTEEGLRRGEIEGGLQDGRYTPSEGIDISHKKVQRRSS